MSRVILIATPENVDVEYELAGLASRFAAWFADLFLKSIFLFILEVILILFFRITHGVFFAVFTVFASLFFLWGYNLYFEIKWLGQTPGKKMFGLQVIRCGGYPVNPQSIFIRNLLFLIDFLPFLCFIGAVSILLTKDYQRIGDLVAGTIVIKKRETITLFELLKSARILPEHLDAAALELIRENAGQLTPDEYKAIKHFTSRRMKLSLDAQQDSAALLARPIMQRLGIVPPEGTQIVDYAIMLEYLVIAYEQLRRPLSIS
jgi:uncharacterized RDD family membrane protein YckC